MSRNIETLRETLFDTLSALQDKENPMEIERALAIKEVACYRLAARISDLKAEGIEVRAELVGSNGHRYARYHLVEKPAQLAMAL